MEFIWETHRITVYTDMSCTKHLSELTQTLKQSARMSEAHERAVRKRLGMRADVVLP